VKIPTQKGADKINLKISNNITAPCLLIFIMLALILFQSVFFKSIAIAGDDTTTVSVDAESPSDTIATAPTADGAQVVQSIGSAATDGKYITYNNTEYQPDKFFILVIISHICVFILPAVFYIKLKGAGYSKKLKLSLPNPNYISLAVYIFFTLIFGVTLINSLVAYLSGFTLSVGGASVDTGGNPVYGAGVLLSFIILPAVCEEFVFRGVLSAEYEKYGAVCAAVITSIAFSLSHFSLVLFPSYLFAAIIFYGLAKVTNCVIFPVILHAGYNFYNIYIWDKLANVLKFEQNRFMFIFLTAVIFMISVYLVFGRIENIYYGKAYKINSAQAGADYIRQKNIKNKENNTDDNNININKGDEANFFIRFFRSFLSPTFIAAIIIFFIYIFL